MIKIGDKVRILKDAKVSNGNSVCTEYGSRSAVGLIGTVYKIASIGVVAVVDLPNECYRGIIGNCLFYSVSKVEKVMDVFEFKVGDKVQVMSEARLNPFDDTDQTIVDAYNVISTIGEIGVVHNIDEDGIYVKDLPDSCYQYKGGTWIYLPEQLRKVEDSPADETQPITKDNIAEVLEFNWIDKKICQVFNNHLQCAIKVGDSEFYNSISYKNPLWIQLVEVYTGKLKPLPVKPKFDFIEYVNSKTTDKQWGKLYNLAVSVIEDKSQGIFRDEYNAKIAVQIAKLAEELK